MTVTKSVLIGTDLDGGSGDGGQVSYSKHQNGRTSTIWTSKYGPTVLVKLLSVFGYRDDRLSLPEPPVPISFERQNVLTPTFGSTPFVTWLVFELSLSNLYSFGIYLSVFKRCLRTDWSFNVYTPLVVSQPFFFSGSFLIIYGCWSLRKGLIGCLTNRLSCLKYPTST